jgi:hypothetical protein
VQPDTTDHAAVAKTVMYIIAGMIAACVGLVLSVKGLDAMPFKVFGLVGAVVFFVAALSMAQYVKRQSH